MSTSGTTHTHRAVQERHAEPIAVLKFGGSVLRDHADVVRARVEVRAWLQRGYRVIAVVSALEGATDQLTREADRFATRNTPADASAKALLLATGELTSASLLGLELQRDGVHAAVCPPWTIGLRAAGQPLDAFPSGLDTTRVDELFRDHDVLVVPGFIGLGDDGRIVLLGRGGSDLSAIFVAKQVNAARCRLVKDVDGLYEYDPGAKGVASGELAKPRRYATLPWEGALKLDGGIVQHKAVRYALEQGLSFEVATCAREDATIVGRVREQFDTAAPRARPVARVHHAETAPASRVSAPSAVV